MFEFIRIQYVLGRITSDQVWDYVPRWITEEQAKELLQE